MTPSFEEQQTTDDERISTLSPPRRQDAYAADVTYGTNNEFGFDYPAVTTSC